MDVSLEIRTESIAAAPRVNIDESRTSRYGPGRARKEKHTGQESKAENSAYKLDVSSNKQSRLSEAFDRLTPEQLDIFGAGVARGLKRINMNMGA
ncbi:hypothetical protein SAMN02910356_01387 [Selenomonas sp. GACV-9]|uniref:hypothetical protein n=1 Tax=Selenomonas sp. GACV-9 TaxID=3158782 RepID=UPI0008E9F7C7|nr:hypothetical protein SAMN02910356_01387 [Selenomonas ruminantium]